ncbi:hypothetical protein J3F83DRAFT_694478, partial [Trichoderma novae-zelandiae]
MLARDAHFGIRTWTTMGAVCSGTGAVATVSSPPSTTTTARSSLNLGLIRILRPKGTSDSGWGLCLKDSASPLSHQNDSVFSSVLPNKTGRWLDFHSNYTGGLLDIQLLLLGGAACGLGGYVPASYVLLLVCPLMGWFCQFSVSGGTAFAWSWEHIW